MLIVILPGAVAAMGVPAGSSSQDLVLAQLDIIAAASGGAVHATTGGAGDPFVFCLSGFVLPVFLRYFLGWSVTPALPTPLVSVAHALSFVIVVGGPPPVR